MIEALAWVTAVASVLSAAFAGAAVLVAWRTLGGAGQQLALLREQARAEARPFVVAQVVPSLHGGAAWDLTIQNLEKSIAREVRLEGIALTPRGDDDYIGENLAKILSVSQTLVPGGRMRATGRREAYGNRKVPAGAEPVVSATLRYGDDNGEECVFDLDSIAAATPLPSDGPNALGENSELKNIAYAVRALSVHVGELRR